MRDDGPGDDQLGALHLGRQQRPYRADQPGLLHQPAGQCPARHAVPGRAAEPQTSALRGTGDARRHQPACQSGGVAVDLADAGDVVRLLCPDPQEGRHRSAGRAAGRNGDADAVGAGLSALAVGRWYGDILASGSRHGVAAGHIGRHHRPAPDLLQSGRPAAEAVDHGPDAVSVPDAATGDRRAWFSARSSPGLTASRSGLSGWPWRSTAPMLSSCIARGTEFRR